MAAALWSRRRVSKTGLEDLVHGTQLAGLVWVAHVFLSSSGNGFRRRASYPQHPTPGNPSAPSEFSVTRVFQGKSMAKSSFYPSGRPFPNGSAAQRTEVRSQYSKRACRIHRAESSRTARSGSFRRLFVEYRVQLAHRSDVTAVPRVDQQ